MARMVRWACPGWPVRRGRWGRWDRAGQDLGRWGQWGQLLFVIHGAVLVTAGLIISGVGCTVVFVPEDLEFMNLCASDLSDANPRLIPLIAHDQLLGVLTVYSAVDYEECHRDQLEQVGNEMAWSLQEHLERVPA